MQTFNSDLKLLIVLPCHNDNDSLYYLTKQIQSILLNKNVKFVIVDDASYKNEPNINFFKLNKLQAVLIKNLQNFGHQFSIISGIYYCVLNHPNIPILVMDSDGEDDPRAIPEMLSLYTRNLPDMVVCSRLKRHNSFTFKVLYLFYKLFFKFLTGKNLNFGNFVLLNPNAASRIVQEPFCIYHFSASILAGNYSIKRYPYNRSKRYHGESKMNLIKLVLHGIYSFKPFINLLLSKFIILSIILLLILAMYTIYAFISKIYGMSLPGWTSTVILISFVAVVFFISFLIFMIIFFMPPNNFNPKLLKRSISTIVST